jgi:uncharacterized protein (DUF58 family)
MARGAMSGGVLADRVKFGRAALAARRAESLGARLPPLLVAAERVAATVAQGVHGRRHVGQGDSFWQYRPFMPGDAVNRIDWRQSARSDRSFIRETEWEAAQTVCLWRDDGATMRWKSRGATVEKLERADLLLLALAALLLRGGERVRLLTPASRSVAGRAGLDRVAEQLFRVGISGGKNDDGSGSGLPADAPLPRHARVVLIGDLLSPLDQVQAAVGRLAAIPVTGHLLQILDPAEALLPYTGRVRFTFGAEGGAAAGKDGGIAVEHSTLIPRVEGVREAYARRLAEQQDGIAAICAAAGWGFAVHRTDHPAEAALLGLYTAMAPQVGRR